MHKTLESRRIKHRKIRHEIFEHYGQVCVCCGETTFEFLTLDHKNGGGNQQRRDLSTPNGGYGYYLKLRNLGYPDYLQVLCQNCHTAKDSFGGCPHQASQIDEDMTAA